MKIQVNTNTLSVIEKDNLNENEYKVHKVQFEFSNEYTQDLVKVALFTDEENTYKMVVSNDECNIPPEILAKEGNVVLGLYAYETESEELKVRYSPTPITIYIAEGSYISDEDTKNSEPITPSEMQQYEQELQAGLVQVQNIDIDAEKVGTTTTVTITDKDGNEKSVQILDGQDGQDGKDGTNRQRWCNRTNGKWNI